MTTDKNVIGSMAGCKLVDDSILIGTQGWYIRICWTEDDYPKKRNNRETISFGDSSLHRS